MSAPDPLFDTVVNGRPVAEGITAAVAAGALISTEAGTLRLPDKGGAWMRESRDASRNCRFYLGVMFRHVYQKTQVPAGCATCFKVKVAPRTLAELVALREVARALPYTYKVGIEESRFTSGIYGGYFYLHGLDDARAAHTRVRDAVNGHPRLGADVSVSIKRGCTDYEVHCGPSDRYTFAPALEDLERALLGRIEIPPRVPQSRHQTLRTFARWIEVAFRIGDRSYLEFTGGRRLYPAVVRYDPAGGASSTDGLAGAEFTLDAPAPR